LVRPGEGSGYDRNTKEEAGEEVSAPFMRAHSPDKEDTGETVDPRKKTESHA
jgi:hypothetical protein